jgi:hypothetical protein
VITSDAFGPWNPPAPEIFRMFVATLLALNVSEDEIRRMAAVNPARVLNLPPQVS